MFQQYPQKDVNEPILLHEGKFRVRSGDHSSEPRGSARLRWLPRPGIEFDIETDEPVGIDLDSLTVEPPGFTTKNVLVHSMNLGATSRIRAFASEMEWGGEQPLLSAGFQIVNCPDFITPGPAVVPGDPTAVGSGYGTIQTVGLNHDGWQVRIVAAPESRDRYRELKATGGYACTHVGQMTRADGSAFAVEEAREILESLRVFLSFARGAACALPIQWGRGEDGEIVWRRLGSPIVDGWLREYHSWFDQLHGGVLAELFDGFCRVRKHPNLREPLSLALHWYRHCNTQSSGLEGSLVLGMAALDLLGALVMVERNGSMNAGEYDALPGARKLRKLASALNIPTDIPQSYKALSGFAEEQSLPDACAALTELRHGFVHANEKRRKIVFGASGQAALFNAWQLSLWYQDLALLYLLRHRGRYRNRTTAKQVGQVEPVPWSAS